jgi:hypothetical protein
MSLTDGASTPSFNTLGEPTSYYCCDCGFGPQSMVLCPQCISCSHTGCSRCKSDATEKNSGREIGASAAAVERVDFTDVSSDVSLTFQRPSPTASATTRLEGIPDMNVTPAVHGLVINGHPADGGSNWYCCQCGDGPNNMSLITGCCMCGHNKCGCCLIEPQK